MNGLGQNAKTAFAAEIDQVLGHATDEQRQAFAAECDAALMVFQDQLEPAVDRQNERPAKMQHLARIAREYAAALTGLGEHSIEMIEQRQFIGLRRSGMEPDEAITRAKVFRTEISKAAAIATATADHAEVLGAKKMSRIDAEDLLITDIALAYDAIFGEQPSASKSGIFRRVISIFLNHAGMAQDSEEIGELRLKRIFAKIVFRSPAPRPGRKAVSH